MRVIWYIEMGDRAAGCMATDLSPVEFSEWFGKYYGIQPAITYVQDITNHEFRRWNIVGKPTILRKNAGL